MIPPTADELRKHSDNLCNLGMNLHNLNGAGRALTNAVAVAVSIVAVLAFLPPMFAKIF